MIVVKVELHSAITGEKSLLGTMIIHNVETSVDGQYANYEVCVGRKTDVHDLRKVFQKPLRKGLVVSHARWRLSIWRLVLKALLQAFPEHPTTYEKTIDHD